MHKQFNSLAHTFLSRMEETFPTETKIKVYRQQFIIIQEMNSKTPVEMFMESMIDYGEQILTKDEKFFKQDQFVNAAESISGKMGLIAHWDTISDKTKDSIWEYIQGLYILGMSSLGKGEELQKVIQITGFRG